MHSFTTLNIGNLFVRYRFTNSYPGDPRPRAEVARSPGEKVGFLAPEPPQRLGKDRLVRSHDLLEPERLDLAVRALRDPSGLLPDVLCLQARSRCSRLWVSVSGSSHWPVFTHPSLAG